MTALPMSQAAFPVSDLDAILEKTEPLWRDLAGARLFVTGGTGFFGRWLLETLAHANRRMNAGVRAVVLTRDPDAFRRRRPDLGGNPAFELWAGDIRSFAFPPGALSHVIHAATDTRTDVPPGELFDSIVEGTRRALDCAVAGGAEGFLLTSSGAVYGAPPDDLTAFPEGFLGAPDPLDLRTVYGQGKRAAETLCAIYHREHGLRATVARCFAFVGPGLPLDAQYAVGNFIGDALAGRTIAVKGDGRALRSYLYAADLAVWLLTILVRGKAAHPYNVGSDEVVSIAELARAVAATQDPALPVTVAVPDSAGGLRSRYLPDIGRAGAKLGLTPSVRLETALRRTVEWHRTANVPEQSLDTGAD